MKNNKNLPLQIKQFYKERIHRIESYKNIDDWQSTNHKWMIHAFENNYMYNFDWLGRPIIQMPSEIVCIQELIWQVQPDLIIETGIAHGGSLILSASMLALLDYCDAVSTKRSLDLSKNNRLVVGIDIDIRKHNREMINEHPLSNKIKVLEGSSVDKNVVNEIDVISRNFKKILVFLDSNHTHDHVLEELNCYTKFVSKGSYCVVFDTIIDDLPKNFFNNRPWDPGNSPKSALKEFLTKNNNFEIDFNLSDKLLTTASPLGFLKRVN